MSTAERPAPNEYTVEMMVERVTEIQRERDCDRDTARRLFYEEVGNNPAETHKWWRGIGPWILREADLEVRHHGGVDLPPNGKKMPANWNDPDKAWFVEARQNLEAAMDRLMSVGNSGVEKRAGDLDLSDIHEIADFKRKQANTMLRNAELWQEIGERMRDGEKLEEALPRLPKRLADFVVAQTKGENGA